jgi:hypothetical protein
MSRFSPHRLLLAATLETLPQQGKFADAEQAFGADLKAMPEVDCVHSEPR